MQVQEDPTTVSAGLPGAFPPHYTAEYQQLPYSASILRLCRCKKILPQAMQAYQEHFRPTTLQSINSYSFFLTLCRCKKILPQALQAYQEGLPPHYTAEYQQLFSIYSDIMQVQEDPTAGSAGLPGRTPTPLHCRVPTVIQHLFRYYAGARRSYRRLCRPTRSISAPLHCRVPTVTQHLF